MTTTKFTNAVTLTDDAWFNDADMATYPCTAVSGTNTIAATAPLGFSAYASGQVFRFIPANTTTGAATFNPSGAGPKNIFWNGSACVGGEIRQNVPVELYYDGTQLNLIGNGSFFPAGGAIVRTAAGEITMPLQPAFEAEPSALLVAVTGDATDYDVVFATEIFDQNADFNASTLFTAPVTGRYRVNTIVDARGLTGSHTLLSIIIVTSNRNQYVFYGNPQGSLSAGQVIISGGGLMDMDAGDTAKVRVTVSGGTKVVDIGTNSKFSGSLDC
jgi:hypothetical protein